MKRLPLLLVTVLLVVFPLWGANSKLLAPGLYQVTSLKGGNVLFYVGSSGVAVVDSGTAPAEGKTVVDEIRSVTDKPILYLFLTHGHPDHVQGACAFPEGTLVVGSQGLDKALLAMEKARQALPARIREQRETVERLRKENAQGILAEEKRLQDLLEEEKEYGQSPIPLPELLVEGRITLSLGDRNVEFLSASPSHTSDSGVVLFPSINALHTGDLVFSGIYPYFDFEGGCDSAGWIAQLKKLQAWSPRLVIPGHGDLGGAEILQAQATLLEELRREDLSARERGLSREEAVKSIRTLPSDKGLRWPEILPRAVDAVYREMDRRTTAP